MQLGNTLLMEPQNNFLSDQKSGLANISANLCGFITQPSSCRKPPPPTQDSWAIIANFVSGWSCTHNSLEFTTVGKTLMDLFLSEIINHLLSLLLFYIFKYLFIWRVWWCTAPLPTLGNLMWDNQFFILDIKETNKRVQQKLVVSACKFNHGMKLGRRILDSCLLGLHSCLTAILLRRIPWPRQLL